MCQDTYRNKPLTEMERVFKALADTPRLRILGLLLTGEACVCHIHESLRISQPKASRHLAYLRRSGLVDTRKEGLWVLYRLAASPGRRAQHWHGEPGDAKRIGPSMSTEPGWMATHRTPPLTTWGGHGA